MVVIVVVVVEEEVMGEVMVEVVEEDAAVEEGVCARSSMKVKEDPLNTHQAYAAYCQPNQVR